MTANTATRTPARAAEATSRRRTLAGTWVLVRFALRRDRIKLPAWLLGITLFVFYYATALPQLYETDEDLQAVTQLVEGPVGALLAGPGHGLANPTIERVVVGVYGLYFLLAAGLMNILLVSRHTRVEEQTGRAELVRASVVGRHAPLTATLTVAVGANALLGLLVAGAVAAADLDTGDALLFGAGVGAAGLAFAGITALTVQVTEYSRAASGLAGAALGAAYVIRAAGDMLVDGGSALSWLSPIAWSQQTRAYVDGRWWPLLLSVAFAAATAAAGYALSTRRDVGAGLVAARGGRASAAPWLRSPAALAFRLQRAGLIGWGSALAAVGLIYGVLTDPILDAYEDMPEEMLAVLGGDAGNLFDGYLSVMALFDALLVAIFAVLGVQAFRAEETKGRTEPVLATATGRSAWFGSHLAVLALGATGLLLVVGLTLGGAAAVSVGDAGVLGDLVAAHLVYLPAVLILVGIAAVLVGIVPRAVGATWAVLGFALIIGFFGPIMDLPQWVHNLSPFEHVSRVPLEDAAWTPLLVLTALGAVLAAVGVRLFRQRDLETK